MGEASFEGDAHQKTVIVGISEVSFNDALQAAVVAAVEAELASVGDELVVLSHSVTVSNPKIGEYKVTVASG